MLNTITTPREEAAREKLHAPSTADLQKVQDRGHHLEVRTNLKSLYTTEGGFGSLDVV